MESLIAGMPDLHGGPSSGSSEKQPAEKIEPAASDADASAIPPDAADAPVKADTAKLDDKAEDVEDKPDAETSKRLATVAKAEKRSRDASDQRKIELDRREAALLAREVETTSKSASFEELQALAKKDRLGVLRKLGALETEDDYEDVGRSAFPHTKAGKVDPRSKPIAEQSAKERALQAEIAELRKTTAELAEQFKTRDAKAEAQAFQARFLDDAVKAIPATPTLIGKLLAKSPEKARQALLAVGARMERENDNETPSHADVIAEYERLRRADLEEQGVDVDAMLKPAAAPVTQPAAKKPAATLDPTATGANARPVDRSKMTEEQRRAEMIKEMPWRE